VNTVLSYSENEIEDKNEETGSINAKEPQQVSVWASFFVSSSLSESMSVCISSDDMNFSPYNFLPLLSLLSFII